MHSAIQTKISETVTHSSSDSVSLVNQGIKCNAASSDRLSSSVVFTGNKDNVCKEATTKNTSSVAGTNCTVKNNTEGARIIISAPLSTSNVTDTDENEVCSIHNPISKVCTVSTQSSLCTSKAETSTVLSAFYTEVSQN